jgi:hypothetical protein
MIISAPTKYPLSHPHAKGAILVHSNIHVWLSIHDPKYYNKHPNNSINNSKLTILEDFLKYTSCTSHNSIYSQMVYVL